MSYVTMEAAIDHGRVIPSEPEKLPTVGRALLTVLVPAPKPNIEHIKMLFGMVKSSVDVAEWQRRIRNEWDER